MSLSRRICEYLIEHPRRGLTDIAWATGCDPTDPKQRSRVASLLHQLTEAGRLRRIEHPRGYRYIATVDALVDRRRRENRDRPRSTAPAASPAPPPAGDDATSAPSPAIEPEPSTEARSASAARPRPTYFDSIFGTRERLPPRGALTSEQIAADIEAFLRSGGAIQRLKPGECSRPLRTLSPATTDDADVEAPDVA